VEENKMKKQTGFTLVEIAIVMVIIGLLLGGVLKGQEIITNAKIKNLENDFTGITAAIYSYQDRYRALPGDDSRANRRFIAESGENIPTGDGQNGIGGAFDADSTNDDAESRIFWLHLRHAGLVDGEPSSRDQPINAFNGITGVSSDTAEIRSDQTVRKMGTYIGFSNIPVKIAIIIESRSDDSNPNDGSVQTQETNSDYISGNIKNAGDINLYFSII
jgi:prepilin-type N-terminal cleavage/methylation domain-containing protein